MYPLPAFFLISIIFIFPLAWLGGGHMERRGVALFLCMYFIGPLVQHIRIGNLLWAEALLEVAFLGGLIWLALKGNRWWPLVAAAFQTMIVIMYAAIALTPEMTPRSGVVASMVLGILGLYCLLGGVAERILAGEAPVSATAIWTPVRKPPAAPNS
tara:strand:- start:2853 stop:3320 length:468 start_codon:yes stop_codon:yes gene_type:complete